MSRNRIQAVRVVFINLYLDKYITFIDFDRVLFQVRVAKFACPRVLDDQKMGEENQKLRFGCPPDYQIFWGKYLKIIVHTNSLRILFLPFPFATNIYHFGNLKQIAYYMVLK